MYNIQQFGNHTILNHDGVTYLLVTNPKGIGRWIEINYDSQDNSEIKKRIIETNSMFNNIQSSCKEDITDLEKGIDALNTLKQEIETTNVAFGYSNWISTSKWINEKTKKILDVLDEIIAKRRDDGK
jgi:hypothetical protein